MRERIDLCWLVTDLSLWPPKTDNGPELENDSQQLSGVSWAPLSDLIGRKLGIRVIEIKWKVLLNRNFCAWNPQIFMDIDVKCDQIDEILVEE